MKTQVTAEFNQEAYDALAKEYRYVITDMICRAGSGHLGGALSLVEIVITLYHRIMRVKPEEPRWEGRDRLVMSKGNAGPVLYVALADKGFFPEKWLGTLNADGPDSPVMLTKFRLQGLTSVQAHWVRASPVPADWRWLLV